MEPSGTTIAATTFSLIASAPYALRRSDVISQVWPSRHAVDPSSLDALASFYSRSHPCRGPAT
ncbi:hypothetical protein [Cellulomonas sp. P5_C5]